jgi:hypothetical protein
MDGVNTLTLNSKALVNVLNVGLANMKGYTALRIKYVEVEKGSNSTKFVLTLKENISATGVEEDG